MRKEKVKEWMKIGLEIEFEHKGKGYYLGPLWSEDAKQIGVMFYEFHQEEADFQSVDAMWNSTYKGLKPSDIFESIPDDQVDGLI